jgi:hypothetical protein
MRRAVAPLRPLAALARRLAFVRPEIALLLAALLLAG